MYTVALPIWNSEPIIWLPLEGLKRQRTVKDWELIVMECRSPREVGFNTFVENWEDLKLAGCKRLKYIYTGKRVPLGQKWKEMAQHANGEYFLLQASDDYPHPSRIEVTNMRGDWYDTRYFHSYSLRQKKLVLFDRLMCKDWKTGNDMAMLTDKVRKLPDNTMNKGVDFYLFDNCAAKRYMDQGSYGGVNTNGANAISLTRERHFQRTYPPFKKAYRTIDELGLPQHVTTRLREFSIEDIKVTAILKEKFMEYLPGDTYTFNFNTFNTLQQKGVVELATKEPYVKELS